VKIGAYEAAVARLSGLAAFGIRPGLERISALLDLLGNPQDAGPLFVHVAGTNGKGSTSAMLASICRAAGHRTGFFSSPHLRDYTERFRLDGKAMDKGDFAALMEIILPLISRVEREIGERPTEFEILTAAAFLYFARNHVRTAVMETGLGGRLDSTNVIRRPVLSIIVHIALDHQAYLGDTLEAIAREKAGVIKPGCPVLTAEKDDRISEVFSEAAARVRAPYYGLYQNCGWNAVREGWSGQTFNVTTPLRTYGDLRIPLMGAHQLINAAAAVYGAEILKDLRLDEAAVRQGLAQVTWPGRLEVLNQNPMVVLDGAHNPDGARALTEWLAPRRRDFSGVWLVAGMLDDKDQAGWAALLDPWVDGVVVTRPCFHKTDGWRDFSGCFQAKRLGVRMREDPSEALSLVLETASEQDLILLAGSLYLAADFRSFFGRNNA
jgi:dihydrofolate synthase/folylpolyglutamate synthase